MIPATIERRHVIEAIHTIQRDGVPASRSREYERQVIREMMAMSEPTDRQPIERVLDLRDVPGNRVEEVTVRECSEVSIVRELVVLHSKDDLQQIPAKSGCYFIFSRKDATSPWLCRNIGTYHGSIRERLRQHCYAAKGTAPHSQKYEIQKSPEQWGVTYRLIEPNVFRYSVEEILIRAFRPRDNKKHNA